jgi:hypothetical protein
MKKGRETEREIKKKKKKRETIRSGIDGGNRTQPTVPHIYIYTHTFLILGALPRNTTSQCWCGLTVVHLPINLGGRIATANTSQFGCRNSRKPTQAGLKKRDAKKPGFFFFFSEATSGEPKYLYEW